MTTSNASSSITKRATAKAYHDVVLSFARWILEQKRRIRPDGLYVVGVAGSIGRGKTVFCQALVHALKGLLKAREGKALSRSLDDYYLPKADRYTKGFLAKGYNPKGISNRGPAGTHDTKRLCKDIRSFERSTSRSRFELPVFEKQVDDRSPHPYQFRGKVGVFLLDGWFVGASTDGNPSRVPAGLKRSVAKALVDYHPVFDRLDALWVFDTPSMKDIVSNRIEQQRTLNRQSGRRGMTAQQIRRFVKYFYRDSWEPGRTSPLPSNTQVSFWATVDENHQFIDIRRGGRL